MATEQASAVPTESGSLAKWASWIAALVGLWLAVSPFVLSGPIQSGTVMWSHVLGGIVIAVLAGFGAYAYRTHAATRGGSAAEWSGWIAALAGLWLLVSPFVLTGAIAESTPMFATLGGGIVALVLAAYTGYEMPTEG